MLNLSVNYGHVAALTVANFLFSWTWYSPLIAGKPFMKALGIKPNRKMTDADKKAMPMLMANGLFCSLAATWALQVLILSTSTVTPADFAQGAALGALCAFGFALTSGLNTLWEKRKSVLVQIGAGLAFVSYALTGGILAVWH
jgi:hypothetical protein